MNSFYWRADNEIDIFVQIARTAFQSGDKEISKRMIIAASKRCLELPKSVSPTMHTNVAELLILNQEYAIAERACKQALLNMRRTGKHDPWVKVRISDCLAIVYEQQHDLKRAKRAGLRTVAMLRRIPEIDKNLIAARLKRLAWLNIQDGSTGSAAILADEARNLIGGRS